MHSKAFHETRLQWMDESGADLIAIETIPDLTEATALAELLVDTRTPTWVSFVVPMNLISATDIC